MKYFLPILLCLISFAASAQSSDSLYLKNYLDKLESGSGYRFFYKGAWIDSVKIKTPSAQPSIEKALDEALAGTGLHYAISGKFLFITKERQLQTWLPDNFFPGEKKQLVRHKGDFDYSAYEATSKKKKAEETRTFFIGPYTDDLSGTATLAGNVRDSKSGEPIIGTTIYDEVSKKGASTDQFGYYSITLPKGQHELKIKSIGMRATQRQVMLYGNGKLNIEMDQEIIPLKEVVVESDKDERLTNTQMGSDRLDISTMRQIPLALGETDVMKVVLTLPGVQTVGEGTVGLNVRGGATNQNLILLNDAVVYNPSHLFGFFSTFNPDILKNVELYKSGIKAEYGGRISSVLDVHTREGNLKKFAGSGGISPVTARLSLEGPIIKDRTSFVIGYRSTYSDWLMHKFKNENLNRSQASFYDLTAGITHKINDNNHIYWSGYMSKDHFSLGNDTAYTYSDRNSSLKWKHIFNTKLFGVLSGSFSDYTNGMASHKNPVTAFDMEFSVKQWTAKADFNYFLNSKHALDFGASTTRYYLQPGTRKPFGDQSQVAKDVVQQENGRENAVYISDNIEVTSKISLYAGVRYSFYEFLGPKNVYSYSTGEPTSPTNIVDTTYYAKGKTIANYQGAEPRVAVRYSIDSDHSVKVSYNRLRQYTQMLSNTTAITPTDTWKLSDRYVRPQIGDQFSVGFYKNIRGKNLIETSVEAYYKMTPHTIDYKNGAVLLLNHAIETDILDAKGRAYGAEFLVKKSAGKLNGWASYTYSRSFLKANSQLGVETVNGGNWYRANADKPHAFNFIGNYKFSRRINFSLNVVYSTGRPITLPIVKYVSEGVIRVYYSDRNAFRIPNYFRSDISLNLEGNHKVKKLAHSSWTIAVYNLTGRKNAYSVFFKNENGELKGYKLSVFGQPIPTITYNFKF